MAKRLFGLKRPPTERYSLEKQMLNKDTLMSLDFTYDETPSLAQLVTEKLWLYLKY